MTLRAFPLPTLLFGLLFVGVAAAGEPPINTNRRGLAVKGYDPVAYFDVGEALRGSEDHELDWSGATWRFVSEENRSRFADDPDRYAPRYGGYCAWAVSRGETADIDPTQFKVVDGRLYLNYSAKIQKRWEEDIPGNISRADQNYPRIIEEKDD